MEAMEMDRWRDREVGDVSEPEDEEKREEVAPMQETPELRYFISILGATSRLRPELPTYDGSLVVEHLIDWAWGEAHVREKRSSRILKEQRRVLKRL